MPLEMCAWFKTEHSLDDSKCRMFQFQFFLPRSKIWMCYCKWPAFLAILPRVILPVCNMNPPVRTTCDILLSGIHFTFCCPHCGSTPIAGGRVFTCHSSYGKPVRTSSALHCTFGNFVGSELSFLYLITLQKLHYAFAKIARPRWI